MQPWVRTWLRKTPWRASKQVSESSKRDEVRRRRTTLHSTEKRHIRKVRQPRARVPADADSPKGVLRGEEGSGRSGTKDESSASAAKRDPTPFLASSQSPLRLQRAYDPSQLPLHLLVRTDNGGARFIRNAANRLARLACETRRAGGCLGRERRGRVGGDGRGGGGGVGSDGCGGCGG